MFFKKPKRLLLATLLLVCAIVGRTSAQSVANYTTTFSTSGSLVNMAGSTDLLATGVYRDDDASAVTTFPSGFSFVYMGTLYTQFSVNSNGQFRFGSAAVNGTAQGPASGAAILAPMGGDNLVLATGKVHFSLVGVSPNRQFIVEWLDLRIPYAASPGAGTGSQVQIVLNETNSSIEYRYGSVFNNSTSVTRSIFMSNGTASATNSKYINLTGPAESNTGTAVLNSLTNNAAVAGLNSTADGDRTVFTFTPPSTPAAPSSMTFSNVTASGMTVNWTDNSSNETGFLVERSTDGITFATVSTTAANATSLALTGLAPGTNYTIRVRALNEGQISSALTSTQTTNLATTYVWNQTGTESYATASNWTPNRTIPDPTDILEFSNGATTTVTGVTSQTIGRLLLSGNTSVTLQSAATATLTIAGTSGTDLDVPAGSTLILGSTSTFTLTHASGAGNTASIAGTLTVNASNTYTTSSSTNVITTVTGVINNSGIVSGSSASLLFNSGSIYNHNFTTSGGTVPTSTWDANSTVAFTTYTSNSTSPSGIGQAFGNVTWNCAAQTGNINFAGSFVNVRGTFEMASTNSGSLRLTGTSTTTLNVNNFNMSGGTLDFASGSGTLTMRVFGSFNQTGGIITETSTGVGVIHFSDTLNTAQNVTLGTINNTFRYIISDVQGINLTGTLTIPTNGSLIINTEAATPINGGTLAYGTAPTTLQYGNGTSGMATLTATEAVFLAASGPSNLIVNNSNGLNLSFSRTVTALTMTAGNINLGGSTLSLGTSATTAGSLTYTAGLIQGGTFTRWFPTTGLPTSASTSIGYFPIGNAGNNRQVQVFFSTTTALSTGGTMSVVHNQVSGTTGITTFTDDAVDVDRRSNSNWVISTADGIAAIGTLNLAIRGDNVVAPATIADLRLIRATDAVGTSANGTGSTFAPVGNRTALSLADVATTFYFGSATANLGSIFTATTSGNWGDNATWDLGSTPGLADLAIINSGVTIAVAGATSPYQALTLTVNGTLNANANTLTLGGQSTNGLTINTGGVVNVGGGTINIGPAGGGNRRLAVSGTLALTSGSIQVNGNVDFASGATFNQSGGDLRIDGNADNVVGNSVVSGTHLFNTSSTAPSPSLNCTAGTITFVDPPINTSTTSRTMSLGKDTGNPTWFSGSHTVVLGDGISTTPGESATGFVLDCWPVTGRVVLNHVTVNAGNGVGRFGRNTLSTANGTYIYGTLTINADSEFRWITAATGDNAMGGNVVNNGTLTIATSTVSFGPPADATTLAVSGAQTISGSGTFRNATTSPTASMTGFLVSNTNGVTFDVDLSVSTAVTINNDCALTMAANRSLNMRTNNLINNGTLSIAASGNFVQGTGSTLSGAGSYNIRRNSGNTSNLRYNMWSSPVTAATLSTLGGTDWYEFDAAANNWSNTGLTGSSTMSVGKGYAATGAGNVLFAGTFNNGNLTPAVSTAGSGFNLIGNPYPSTINAFAFLTANTNIDGTLWFWSQPNNATVGNSGGDYATWSTLGGVAGSLGGAVPDSNVGVGQGFFVKANSGTTVTMNNAMRLTNQGSNFRVTETAERVWFNLTGTGDMFNQLLLGFSPDARDARDIMDATKMKGNVDLAFYSYIGNEHLAIQAMAPRGNSTRIVPVGLEVTNPGSYSISIDHIENLAGDVSIHLKDARTGQLHDLRLQPYVFGVGYPGSYNNRFEIHFGPSQTTSVAHEQTEKVRIYSSGQSLFLKGFEDGTVIHRFEVRDAAGRIVFERTRPQMDDLGRIELSVATGVYLARIITNNGIKTERIYLSK